MAHQKLKYLQLHIYLFIYIYIYIYYMYVCMYCMYVCIVCMYVCTYACMHACMHDVCMYVCMYAYVSIYIYVCINICRYIYICTNWPLKGSSHQLVSNSWQTTRFSFHNSEPKVAVKVLGILSIHRQPKEKPRASSIVQTCFQNSRFTEYILLHQVFKTRFCKCK